MMNLATRTTVICAIAIGLSMDIAVPAASASRPTDEAPTAAPGASLLPEPSGRLVIGVRTVAAASPFATTRVWYPARRGTGQERSTYLVEEPAAALGVDIRPMLAMTTHAFVDATPLTTDVARPGVVLMPGWGTPVAWSTALTEELVSNGYVVVTVDPDPTTEDPFTLPADVADPARRFAQLSAAIRFITGPKVTPIAGPVDRRTVAVGGHSIAGAVAFQASLTDRRISAVFDLDGWLHGPALVTPVQVPALAIDASGLDAESKAIIASSDTSTTVELEGATHVDVTDLPCLAPALGESAAVLGLGTIGCVGTRTTNTIVRRFLDRVMKDGRPSPSAGVLGRGLAGVRR